MKSRGCNLIAGSEVQHSRQSVGLWIPSEYGRGDMDQATLLRGKPGRIMLAGAAFLLLVAIPYLFAHLRQGQRAANRGESTVKVERKNFGQVIRLNGTTQASRSFVVLAPKLEGAQVGSMVITKLVPAGTHVKKDAFLVEFDPQAQTKDYLDKKSTYENLVGQVAQKQAEDNIARAKDDTAMKQAEDELKRAAAVAAIRIQEIQRDRALEAMRYAQGNAAKMVVHSPMQGVVVYNTIWLGGRMGTVQQGDQVRPGVPFLQVVDPSQMEVRVALNQVDLLKVRVGQQAQMRLDAYPGMTLPATLEELSPLGHPGQFAQAVRSFTARFSVQGTDPRLLPDLSAALDLELGSQKNVLVVPWQSIGIEANHSYVWLKTTGGFEKRTVQTGPRTDLEVIVNSG